MTDFAALLGTLAKEGVQFIIVGGAAATAHGSARRGAPLGLPFQWDERTLRRGLNFTLTTALGDIDLRGENTGGGTYDDLLPHGSPAALRHSRPPDLEAIAELEAILEETGGA